MLNMNPIASSRHNFKKFAIEIAKKRFIFNKEIQHTKNLKLLIFQFEINHFFVEQCK